MDESTATGAAGSGRLGPRTVAFQGEAGAFSEEALFRYFGKHVDPLPQRDFPAVASAVTSGEAIFGILPVENTRVGSVQPAYDVLADGGLRIVGEVVLPIRHFLLGVPGAPTEGLRKVLSHPVALAQCTRFLSARSGLEAVAVYDTAGAAKEVAERGDPSVGAVAAEGAARRYGLGVLHADIQDRDDNQTRFYVVERDDGPASVGAEEADRFKTVLLLEVEDRPGSLLEALQAFASRGINLTKLESRPGSTPWRYRFVLEFQARLDSEAATAAVHEARERASLLHVLGSFPAAASPPEGRP